MQKIPNALLAAVLGVAFALVSGAVPDDASALVFCAKNRNPSKIKVRGDACKARETEVSLLDTPEVQAEIDALASELEALRSQSHVYVVTDVRESNGGTALIGKEILCDEGDVATGGGVTSNSAGSGGPFVHYSGPALDEFGTPIGWRIGIGEVRSDIEFHVVCAAVGGSPPVGDPGAGPGPGPILPSPPPGTIGGLSSR